MHVIVQMIPFERDMHGVALIARGPEPAGWRPHLTDGCLPDAGVAYAPDPRPGCPGRDPDRPREMLLPRVPARTLMRCQRCALIASVKPQTRDTSSTPCPPQARSAASALTRLAAGVGQKPGPVAGFARPSREKTARQRNRDGRRLPEPHAQRLDARSGAFPPAWLETFAIHPAAGVKGLWHGVGSWGKE